MKNNRLATTAILIISCITISWSKTPVNKYDFSYLDQRITTWVDSGYYQGAAVIIGQGNKEIYKRYYGNYNPQTTVYVASAGKWVGAAVIAAVVDKGYLSWNDKVKKWLPQFTDIKGEATLRQLLSHTSGYPSYQPKGHHTDNYQTLKESVDSIVNLPVDTVPGVVFNYGGLAMQVAGRMAEIATGKDFESLFLQYIAQPLHMTSMHFIPVDNGGGHSPMIGGGLRTNLQDCGNFLNMILNNGVYNNLGILSTKSIQEMQANQTANVFMKSPEFPQMVRGSVVNSSYGLGEWREELNDKGEATIISSPGWAGAYPWIDKKYNIYGFILTHIDKAKDGFNSMLGSPVLPYIARDVIDRNKSTDVKKEFIPVKDGKLYYEELGKGEPLILIPGHSLDNTMWDNQFHEFAKKYRVIRYDARGYGQSTMPDENKQFMHVEDLIQLMDYLKIPKAHMVGLSMGGFIVLDCIALHQDRMLSGIMASGNIFPANGPDKPWTLEEITKRNKDIAELKAKGIDVFKREWFNALVNSGGTQKDLIRPALWKMIYEWEAWQPLHREPRLLLGNSVFDKMKKVKVTIPVLVLEGNALNNHFKAHPAILDLIPSAQYKAIDNAGHMMNMEQPKKFNFTVMEFLNRVK
jgi:CubicO group peptidase (beta-lactamase class C family)/pimeloyl-ACP methyl ester carboxylesterase